MFLPSLNLFSLLFRIVKTFMNMETCNSKSSVPRKMKISPRKLVSIANELGKRKSRSFKVWLKKIEATQGKGVNAH